MKTFSLMKFIFFGFFILAFNANCLAYTGANPTAALPSSATGGANLMNNLNNDNPNGATSLRNAASIATTANANNVTSNQTQLINEFHLVTITSGSMTAATYLQNYVSCANGGVYVPNSLVSINSTSLYYFCQLPIYSWYYSSTTPVSYQNANGISLTYSQVAAGLVQWANPNLPSSTGYEQITTNPTYRNGLPLTTFLTENCTNVGSPANAFNKDKYNVWLYGFLYGNVSIKLGLTNETDTTSTYSNGCNGVSSAVAAVIPNQVLTVTINYTNQDYLIAEADSNPQINTVGTPGNHPVETDPGSQGITTNSSATCTANYTVQAADVGNTVYIICVCPANSNESGLPSGCPIATNAATSQYLVTSNSAFQWSSLSPWTQSYPDPGGAGGIP